MAKTANRYERLIADVFFRNHQRGDAAVEFDREELATVARELGVKLPQNLGGRGVLVSLSNAAARGGAG